MWVSFWFRRSHRKVKSSRHDEEVRRGGKNRYNSTKMGNCGAKTDSDEGHSSHRRGGKKGGPKVEVLPEDTKAYSPPPRIVIFRFRRAKTTEWCSLLDCLGAIMHSHRPKVFQLEH